MPTAIETRLAQLEELVHPGVRERAKAAERTAEEQAEMADRFAAATARRDRALAAHGPAVKAFRAAVVAAVTARARVIEIEVEIENALHDQRFCLDHGHVADVPTYIPHVATTDFSFLLLGIDEQTAEIARRAA